MYENNEVERYKDICKKNGQIVTVFMTAGNRKAYISDAIEGVLRQTYTNFCFIVLDNMSVDGTLDIVEDFMKNDDRIFLIQRESTNQHPNVEFAFKICVTKYMAVFHDDDVAVPDYLEKMIGEMERSDYWLVCPQYTCIDEMGKELYPQNSCRKRVFSGTDYLRVFWRDIEKDYRLCYPANFYRTEHYRDYKRYFNVPLIGKASDQCIGFQTERFGGRFEIYPEILYRYRIHRGQDSATAYGVMDMDLLKYLLHDNYYYEKLQSEVKDLSNRLINIYKKLIINYAYNCNKKWIIESLDVKASKFKHFSFKTRLMFFLFRFSSHFFAITIGICSKIYRRSQPDTKSCL